MGLRTYLILIGGLIVAPALVVGSLVIVIDGSVPDFSDPRDVLGFAVNGGFGLIIWIIAARVFRRSSRGEAEATSDGMAMIAKFQPLLWLVGIGIGVAGALSIIDSARENRSTLARMYCEDALELGDPRLSKCLVIALDCSDEVDAGPCGQVDSTQAASQCVAAHKEAKSRLTETERDALPELSGGDYDDAMRAICIVEKSRAN